MGGGVGGLSCPSYIQFRSKAHATPVASVSWFNQMARFTMFIEGYRTSYNELTPDTFDVFGGLEDEQMLAWTENWCNANPLEKWAAAVVALAREHYPHRQRSRER